jgi:tetratricopeptide (TPR) repeat protein
MNWKEQLSEIESHFGRHENQDWEFAIELIKSLVEKYPNDVEVYIRTIYLIHNILVEEDYPNGKHDEMADLLKKYFDKSYSLFSENAEYLFFIGKILHIAEWYFGLDNDELAMEMQKKAMDKEPGNLLYEWAYRLSCSGDIVEGYLANQLIEYEKEKVDWLKSKGFPGNYVLEHLQMSNQKYLDQ